ncbi:Sugar kinase of the NBD/HSP70 family, may contain an N-terminal HTH domain [Phyllobacterium sp. YR620]|uniref:ROK family transcriptional regulator n=1 Tax=Phyllobacterium sp. YR620 TaxID=1881066 RepID=UPI00089255DA|nr:ROK family transcriptional regulator [Phyllobacterium sp. YR620]SDO86666.1 Sugar kinase of the NBD/HSP70 family, may contain an N-terminal HTH domain [Phyllobacterium sp. YR620]
MNDKRPIRAKSGTNLGGASAHNRRIMIDALRVNGALSRADLARATGLTPQTVSNIIEELASDGLVRSQATVRRGRGQPATPYQLVPEGAFAIGLQIDRHVTRTVIVNLVGEVLVKFEAKLPPGGPAEGVLVILDLVRRARAELAARTSDADKRLVGLGVAMPGPFGINTLYDDPWMMTAWQNFPLIDRIAEGTGLEVALQNDAAAAATAERLLGAAHGLDHAICIYFGYGLGAGLILNGELYGGAHANAGEIGMILALIPGDGDDVEPLEHYASMASLCKLLSIDPSEPQLFEMVSDALQKGSPQIEAWIADVAQRLRRAIQALESIFDPQTIILCGGAPRRLIDRLVKEIGPLLPSIADRASRFPEARLQAGLADPWSVALGAAAEPIARTFDPRFSAILKST